jgi:uncharacterized integral membrane protein (TIGR00698 family)
MQRLKDLMPGMGITASVVFMSYMAGSLHPGFNPLVVSLVFGMLAANIIGDREPLKDGTGFCMSVFLPLGIALHGFGLDVRAAGAIPVLKVVAVVAVMFAVTYFVSRGFGVGKADSVLLSTGLSTCGPAAVAVISPMIGARRDDTSISVISIFAVGLAGMLVYRFTSSILFGGAGAFGPLPVMTLPMLGMAEVAMLDAPQDVNTLLPGMYLRMGTLGVFAAVVIGIYGTGRKRWGKLWFAAVFIVLSVAASMGLGDRIPAGLASETSRAVLVAGLAAVGLSVEFDAITRKGSFSLLAAFLSWIIVVLAVYLAANIRS